MVVRNTASFSVSDTTLFKHQVLSWVNQFNICCFLDTVGHASGHCSYDCLAAAGATTVFSPTQDILGALGSFYSLQDDWLFGHIGYDLKRETAGIFSDHPDPLGFSPIFLFQPEVVVGLNGHTVFISCLGRSPLDVFEAIQSSPVDRCFGNQTHIAVLPRTTREEYLATVDRLRGHILKGDCYEINYCIEFYSANASIDPLAVYRKLADISPNPFGCYYKCDDKFLLCASPERYLKKDGNMVISQPVKGTLRRHQDQGMDDETREALRVSEKDRRENIMVVDLVRNDLSRICKPGSVCVDELFGVYTFPQVHQMISTVRGELQETADLPDILLATFPMGSMTGAPKQRVMQLIEQYESTARGIYSGAVGYITPGKDFDFNVVIRSIMYNASEKYLSYQVGSGITFYSDPVREYEECLLKAKAIEQVLA